MTRVIDYSTFEFKLIDAAGKVTAIDLPRRVKSFGLLAATNRHLIVQLAEPAMIAGQTQPAETVLAYDVSPSQPASNRVSVIFAPGNGDIVNDSFRGIVATATRISLIVDRHLAKRVVGAEFDGTAWKTHDELAAAGYRGLSVDQLIALRDHGVGGSFIAGLKSAGYGDLSVDDLIRLRDHGVSVEDVQSFNAMARRRLRVRRKRKKTKHNKSTLGVSGFAALEVRLTIDISPSSTPSPSAARSQVDSQCAQWRLKQKDTAITATRPMVSNTHR